MNNVNYYDLLGVKQTATLEEIKTAYHNQAMKYHPDRNNGSKESEEYFKQINEAYNCLSNPVSRASYGNKLRNGFYNNTSNDTSGNSYYSSYSSSPKQKLNRQEQILKDYITKILNEARRGKEQVREYILNLRRQIYSLNFTLHMPLLHYLIIMFIGYAILEDNKWVYFFIKDIKDKDECINVMKKTFPQELVNNTNFFILIENFLRSYKSHKVDISGLGYTPYELSAFKKELDIYGVNASAWNNYTNSKEYSSVNTSGSVKKSHKRNNGNDLSYIRIVVFLLFSTIISVSILLLLIKYWKYILLGILYILII